MSLAQPREDGWFERTTVTTKVPAAQRLRSGSFRPEPVLEGRHRHRAAGIPRNAKRAQARADHIAQRCQCPAPVYSTLRIVPENFTGGIEIGSR